MRIVAGARYELSAVRGEGEGEAAPTVQVASVDGIEVESAAQPDAPATRH